MNAFVLHLESATQYERIENVTAFAGQDDSGGFGILAGHMRMMTVLTLGLARFRVAGGEWEYLALPGALAYFVNNELHIGTRRYLRDKDFGRMAAALREELMAEEEAMREMKRSVKHLEQAMYRRLREMRRVREL
jgi:F-type H+-transporting ATPase subunit epsilon